MRYWLLTGSPWVCGWQYAPSVLPTDMVSSCVGKYSMLEYQKLFWVVSNFYLYHTYHVREKTLVEQNTYFLPKIWEFWSNSHPPLSTCEYVPVYSLCSHVVGLDRVPFHPHLLVGRKLAFGEGWGVASVSYSTTMITQNTTTKHVAAHNSST